MKSFFLSILFHLISIGIKTRLKNVPVEMSLCKPVAG